MGQINIGGASAAVQLQGNDTITTDQAFTFPDTGGELLTGGDVDISGTLSTANFDGTVAPVYGIRAWANVTVNAGGATNINGGGNIASVQIEGDHFRVTFTTPMSSTNYAVFAMAGRAGDANNFVGFVTNSITVNGFLVGAKDNSGGALTSDLILFIQVVL